MIALTLAQMRRSLSRLVPAGLAIALGTAFVAATLVTGNVMTRATYDGISAQYAHADLVVTAAQNAEHPLDEASLATVRAAAGVTSATGLMTSSVQLSNGSRQVYPSVIPVADDPTLNPLTLAEGAVPRTDREIALPAAIAKRLGVGIGDTVQGTWWRAGTTGAATAVPTATATATGDQSATAGQTSGENGSATTQALTVIGIVDDPTDAYSMSGGMGLATSQAVAEWRGDRAVQLDAVLLRTSDVGATRAALTGSLPSGTVVQTKDEMAAQTMANLSDGSNQLVALVLGFAAIALLVAALVIANTFQVLVAQRTRTLALLRCVGARRSQLRASVLTEGALLGLASSVVGLLAGLGLAQVALLVLGRMHLGVPLPTVVPLSLPVFLVPILVGTLVTVGATLVPARAATRVSPIAALHPQDVPTAGSSAGRARLVFSVLLAVGGTGVLIAATLMAHAGGPSDRMLLLLAAGVLGGAVSFIGILVGAVFWMPRVVALVGGLLGRVGPASRLAAANTRRNPRRTAATSAALLIGVTLVMTMSAGAASARSSLTLLLDEHYPVDLVVGAMSSTDQPAELTGGALGTVQGTAGVAHAVVVDEGSAQLEGVGTVAVYGLDAHNAPAVLHDRALSDALAAGSVLVRSQLLPAQGASLHLSSTSRPDPISVTAVKGSVPSGSVIVSTELLRKLDPNARPQAVWAALSPDADAAAVLSDVQDALSKEPVAISSPAAERAGYERIIDTLLGIVVGLLAVAVVIALIGVTNTLSLSVLERRRESATLRAVGMTRRQLRGTLAVEGTMIAGVGAILGIGLGLLYGWAGAAIVFGSTAQVHLAVPWSELGYVVVVAVLAGLLASVLPARSAARTPPVAALASE